MLEINKQSAIFTTAVQLRWSDYDLNHHLKHYAYNDCATQARVEFMSKHGMNLSMLATERHIAPMLLEEHTKFVREVRMTEASLEVGIFNINEDKTHKRHKLHHVLTNSKNGVVAEITIVGAWVDLRTRKMIMPPQYVVDLFQRFPNHT